MSKLPTLTQLGCIGCLAVASIVPLSYFQPTLPGHGGVHPTVRTQRMNVRTVSTPGGAGMQMTKKA